MADKYWGYHLILDIFGCNENVNTPTVVKLFLEHLVKELRMSPIGPPQVIYVDWDGGRGVTGVQIITTSTITFHGDAKGNKAYIDVFSL
jgi:S-adenosylmethionine/arginine decarboxylase-like enzyme